MGSLSDPDHLTPRHLTGGRARQEALVATHHFNRDRLSGWGIGDGLGNRLGVCCRYTVDGQHHIADADPGPVRRPAGRQAGDAQARADYAALLDDLEQNFAARTRALLTEDRTDLTIEIDVLRDRLQREGVRVSPADDVQQ